MKCDKASTERKMRDLVYAVGGEVRSGENRKGWLARVARAAGISPRSASAAYYNELRGDVHRAGVEAKLKAAAGKQEANSLATQFESLANAMVLGDQDFHSTDIAALLDAARALRGLDRTGNHNDG